MNFSVPRIVVCSVAFAWLSGCALIPGMGNLTGIRTANPLADNSAPPLRWSGQPKDLPYKGQSNCTVWPIVNSMAVTVTDDKICVTAALNRLVRPQNDGSMPQSLSAFSDGSLEEKGGFRRQISNPIETHPSKAGTCVDELQGLLAVWVANYDACIPNLDVNGKPLVTKDSSYLAVGDAKWIFPAATASATDSKPSPTTNAATPSPSGGPSATTATESNVITLSTFGIKGSVSEPVEMDAHHYGELASSGDGFHVAVHTPPELRSPSLARTQRDVALGLSGKKIKSESLADGWLVTFDTTDRLDATQKRFQVVARRKIGGKLFSCSGNEPSEPLRARAVAFCKSLALK